MLVYRFLDGLGRPRSYLGKILVVSFVGVHIPLIGAVAYLLLASDLPLESATGVLAALLVATLVGTGATMACLYALLAPVREAASAIRGYLREKKTPLLPTQMQDEAGVLMANIQEGITRLDAALDAAQARLRETEGEARSKFGLLSAMSHEVRTPLNHIIGFAEMMATEALGPLGQKAYRGYASDIGSSGSQLLSVLQTMLDLADAASADGDLKPEPMALGEAVRAAAGLVHLQAEAAGAALRIGVASDVMAQVDPRVLKQALLHGLQMAIETSAGAISVVGHQQAGAAVLEIAYGDAPWRADDVPEELRRDLPDLAPYSAAQSGADAIRSASPAALRLSLMRTLMLASAGTLSVRAGERGSRIIRLSLPAVEGVRLRRAA